ncbi:MAG TPA: hypothetical protein VLM05_19520, partial [Mycobacteriales bacterium]|nr:hypothetical protein [Mycobacteriales bacterium]
MHQPVHQPDHPSWPAGTPASRWAAQPEAPAGRVEPSPPRSESPTHRAEAPRAAAGPDGGTGRRHRPDGVPAPWTTDPGAAPNGVHAADLPVAPRRPAPAGPPRFDDADAYAGWLSQHAAPTPSRHATPDPPRRHAAPDHYSAAPEIPPRRSADPRDAALSRYADPRDAAPDPLDAAPSRYADRYEPAPSRYAPDPLQAAPDPLDAAPSRYADLYDPAPSRYAPDLRDAWVDLPACPKTGGGTSPAQPGQFNEAFTIGGPSCTVLAVQKLTGVKINH